MVYIGIDNGVSGGLCAVGDTAGIAPIAYRDMPTQQRRKSAEVDVVTLVDWLSILGGSLDHTTVILEEPSGSKSANAAKSMAGSFHAVRAACEIKRIRLICITPQKWKKAMRCESSDKDVALTVAKQLWPRERWLASERSRVPHIGIVDAALIAEYARRAKL